MVRQLDERNAEVVTMKERLHHVDRVPEEHEQVMGESPEPCNNQQELLRIVKGVAQQQGMGELRELEEDPEEEKHGFWLQKREKGSACSRKSYPSATP